MSTWPSHVSPKGARTHFVSKVVGPHLILRRPEAELLGPARHPETPAPQGEKPGGAPGQHAELFEIAATAERLAPPLPHDPTGAARSVAANPDQVAIRSCDHLHGVPLRVGKGRW